LICKFETQTGLRINDVIKELTNGKYTIELYHDHYFVRNFRTQKETVIINFLFFTKELADLIQSVSGIDDLTNLDLSTLFLTRKGTRINKADYLSRLKVIISELGINGNIKTHALRKYYNSQLSKNRKKLDDDRILTHWEGREAPYTDQIYLRHIKDLDFYYTEWKKLESEVCIDCIVYDKTNVEIKNLKAQYDDIIKQNIEKDKEIAQLRSLEKKMLVMDKNFDKILKVLDDKEKKIDELSKVMLGMTEFLKDNKEKLTDKQKEKLKEFVD